MLHRDKDIVTGAYPKSLLQLASVHGVAMEKNRRSFELAKFVASHALNIKRDLTKTKEIPISKRINSCA